MRGVLISENRYLIKYLDNYYVVNSETKKLFDAFELTDDIHRLSRVLDLPTKEVRKKYTEIKEKMNNALYYPQNISLKSPVKIHWKITPECNLKCKHCYLGDLVDKKLSADYILKIAEYLSNSDILEVSISGGEALTVKELPEVLEKFVSKKIFIHIFTNGILIPQLLSKLDHVVFKKHLEFEVSVDGMEAEHDAIRGKNCFKSTIKGITSALELGYRVSTNSVISKLNYKSLPMLFSFLKGVGVRTIQFSPLVDKGRATSDMKLSVQEELDFIQELKKVVSKKPYNTKLLYTSRVNNIIQEVSKEKTVTLGRESWKCGAGIGRATIDHQGNVFCCPFWEKSCLGNILQKPIDELWQNKNRFLFLKELANRNQNERVCIVARERVCDE